MKLRTTLVAALAALTFAACSKDGDNGGTPTIEGKDARLGVTLKMPAQTRAYPDDINATTAESAVKSVTVYVFNASNGVALSDGGYTHFPTISGFFTESSGTYTLDADKNIKAISGNAKVYVAANLPAAKAVAYATEALMLQAFDELAKLDNSDAATGFTMFSEAVTVSLQAYNENDPSTIGKASANLDRVVSKVVGSKGAASYTQTWTGFGDVSFEYVVEILGVYNEAIDSYLAKNATTKSTLNTFTASAAKTPLTLNLHPAPNDISAMTGYYICENYEGPGVSTFGKTTYSMVGTTVAVSKEGEWDPTADGGDGDIVYTDVTPYGGGSTDVYVVKYNNISYITTTKVKAEAITAGLETKYSLPANSLDGNIYLYAKGYVHFVVHLNREGANDYRIDRNQFIHVKVNGVSIGDGQFPGYPGDPIDPTKPIDPTDPTDPNNPDPIDPVDPVDPDAAALNIEIEINNWTYKANETILQ